MSSIGIMVRFRCIWSRGRVIGFSVMGFSVIGCWVVGFSMIGCWVVGSRVVRCRVVRVGMMGVLWYMNIGVLMRVLVQLIKGHCFTTINLVPEFTSKLILIKQGSIRAHKTSTLRSISTIITHTINLATSLWISIHTRLERSIFTAKLSVWRISMARIVFAGYAWGTMLIVMLLMVVGVLVVWLWCMIWVRSMIRCWFMVCRLGCMIGSRFMVCWSRWTIRGRFMVSWSRWTIRGRFMISRFRCMIGIRLMVSWGRWTVRSRFMIRRRAVRSRFIVGWSRWTVRGRFMISRSRRTIWSGLMICSWTIRSWFISCRGIRSCRSWRIISYASRKGCKLGKSLYSVEVFSKFSQFHKIFCQAGAC